MNRLSTIRMYTTASTQCCITGARMVHLTANSDRLWYSHLTRQLQAAGDEHLHASATSLVVKLHFLTSLTGLIAGRLQPIPRTDKSGDTLPELTTTDYKSHSISNLDKRHVTFDEEVVENFPDDHVDHLRSTTMPTTPFLYEYYAMIKRFQSNDNSR